MSVPVSAATGLWATMGLGADETPAAACAVLLGGARLAKGSGVWGRAKRTSWWA